MRFRLACSLIGRKCLNTTAHLWREELKKKKKKGKLAISSSDGFYASSIIIQNPLRALGTTAPKGYPQHSMFPSS